MLNKEQIDNLLYSLSSFYRDHLPVDNNLMKLVNIYAKTIDYVWNYYRETNTSRFISTTQTLETIPYYKVNIKDAKYDLNLARIIARLSFDEQIAYLTNEGKFARFVFERKDKAGEPSVYSMRLFTDFAEKNQLRLYEDYFIKNNRLYLLPLFIQKGRKPINFLHAFDIKYNAKTLEKNFGTLFNLEVGPLLSRTEYRDVLEAFIRAFKGDMTIKSLKESIQLATKWEEFSLEDYKSPNISARKKQLYEDWIISPLRFILTLPENLIPDKIKINIVRTLLAEIKMSDTDYMIFFDIDRTDTYTFPLKDYEKIYYNRADTFTTFDGASVPLITMEFKEYPIDLYGRYDTIFYYNLNLQYDDPPGNEIVSILNHPSTRQEMLTAGDSAKITFVADPRIPRQFIGTADSTTGSVTFSLAPNSDSTVSFELYGSSEIDGPYSLIETLTNDSAATSLTFNHNANESENRYYKARAIGSAGASLFTLPIDKEVV